MSNSFKFLLASLLLLLAVAVGTEVAALHRHPLPVLSRLIAPVVVRKAPAAPAMHKTVHSVRHRAS
jgi:hypothetical protein